MIAIIDYDAGNLGSVDKAFAHIGAECTVTRDPKVILGAKGVVLPGVGAFASCMDNLVKEGMDSVVRKCIDIKKPFLGICVGFQMLFESSEEHLPGHPDVPGLGIFKGKVRRFSDKEGLKIPQMGWNRLNIKKPCPLFEDISDNSYVYFVHSYYVDATDRSIVSAEAEYGVSFDAAISCDNIFATQFHPEKSGVVGLKLIDNFVKAVYKK